MAGNKKKKKPPANPARGFATTSIASKPREDGKTGESKMDTPLVQPQSATRSADEGNFVQTQDHQVSAGQTAQLTAEQFEAQLEESELQLFVERFAEKTKRDASRQVSRLYTDRRLLRSGAEALNLTKWLPHDLTEHLLQLVQGDGKFVTSGIRANASVPGRMPPEEDLIARLWTLQQTLIQVSFPEPWVDAVVQYVLDIAPDIAVPFKDFIWGLEESLDWLARECEITELPSYEDAGISSKTTSNDNPTTIRPPSPKSEDQPDIGKARRKRAQQGTSRVLASRKASAIPVADIDPDELIPAYIESKTALLRLERHRDASLQNQPHKERSGDNDHVDMLQAKLSKIENDPLFDSIVADQMWKTQKVVVEKEIATEKRQREENLIEEPPSSPSPIPSSSSGDDDVNVEAARVAAEVLELGQDALDDSIEGLFASLPQIEMDPVSGNSRTFFDSPDGERIILRNFGKWSGVSPRRILEEACRSRDAAVKVNYKLISEASYANRHALHVVWTKSQPLPLTPIESPIDVAANAMHFAFTMLRIATPTVAESEAYVATVALYSIFAGSAREEKASMRLPAIWRDVWSEFASLRKNRIEAQDRAEVKVLRCKVRERLDRELEDGVLLKGPFRGRLRASPANSSENGDPPPRMNAHSSSGLKQLWAGKAGTAKFQKMLQNRKQLPIWGFKGQVVDAVHNNQVVIVCGETGCGKSTQVPTFLLEDALSSGRPCKIYCTEPRRISAVSLARRVSEELGESRGELGTSRSLIGYSIRLESSTVSDTRLIYATTGIVMRMLESSADLHDITHLIIDEVHERTIDSDFLLIVLRRLLSRRRDLKIILMSATVDAERFSNYLDQAPVLNVPGRTFPVDTRFLEDAIELTGYTPTEGDLHHVIDHDEDQEEDEPMPGFSRGSRSDQSGLENYSFQTRRVMAQFNHYRINFELILQLVAKIAMDTSYQCYSKAVLIFLPGIAEIRTLHDMFSGDPRFAHNWLIHPLHSSIATEEQESAFLIPPTGFRKIVLATNIAETGITIPDVTCVIDTGKHREMRFDERRQLSKLIETFISKANAKQRRGRAGRVQKGLCFHMFTKQRHDEVMSDQQAPEMLRLSLQDLAIRVKICKLGSIEETLGDALDPPSSKNIRRAVDALVDVRALTSSEELTPLGYQLAKLPLDVFLGKLILLGSIFKCLDMALTIAAVLSAKSPFSAPFGQKAQADNARATFRCADSDLLTVYNAYRAWRRVCQVKDGAAKEFQFCRKHFLNQQTLVTIEELKGHLLASLAESGFLQLTDDERRSLGRARGASTGRARRQQSFVDVPLRVDSNSDNDIVSASVIAWSFYPKLLVRDQPGMKGLRNIGNNQSIKLHPTSVNRGHADLKWLSYYNIMQSKTVYHAHETTSVEPVAIALLCGEVRYDLFSGVVVLDGNRARFAISDWKTILILKAMRTRLRELLIRSFKQPGKLISPLHQNWLDAWQKMFSLEQGESKNATQLSLQK